MSAQVDRARLTFAASRFISAGAIRVAISGGDVAKTLRSSTGLMGGSCDEAETGSRFFASTPDGVSFHHLRRDGEDRVERVELDTVRWADIAAVIVAGIGPDTADRLAEWGAAWTRYNRDHLGDDKEARWAEYRRCSDLHRALLTEVAQAGLDATETVEQGALF